jgi:hypothetical protein
MTCALTTPSVTLTIEHMSEKPDGSTVWRIQIRPDILAKLATHPTPEYAKTEAERDWHLAKMLHRPREDYIVEEVPGPVEYQIGLDRARWIAKLPESQRS